MNTKGGGHIAPTTLRRLALGLGVVLVTSACTTTPALETTTPDTQAPSTTAAEVAPGTTLADPFLSEPLPVDDSIRIGTLDNGLTYYVKHNDSPGRRLELRLMVDAGSVQEDDDQAGIAHFLEHMMFNGTERFPRNDLIGVLESFGPRFGPDINAFTSFDETVYELSLTTGDDRLVQLGIDVLREWAGRATLVEDDVVGERGVVLDEWRLRDLGFNARVSDAFQDLILPGTDYEGRLPIGDDASIQATTPDLLSRFYRDWYRPDLMAVAAVGDIDVEEMEQRIIDAFGDLPSVEDPRAFERAAYSPPSETRARGIGDEEAARGSITIVWPTAGTPMATVGDFRSAIAGSLAIEMLANRLNDDALRGEAPLLGAAPLQFGFTRAIEVGGIDLEARSQDLAEALEVALTEVRRIQEHGFSDEEVERALARFEAASEQRHQQRESVQDAQIMGAIVGRHLAGGHLMSPEQQFEVESRLREILDRAVLESVFRELSSVAPVILAVGPDEAPVPGEEQILEAVARVSTSSVTVRKDGGSDVVSLMAVPDAVPPTSAEVDSRFGYHTLLFDNGATVYLWRSDIAADGVYAAAESFGGTSLIDLEDLPEAFLMTEIIARSGIGPADVPTLQRLLASRLVQVIPWVSETREGLTASSASKDVETLFQMIHLHMTAPRFDDVALESVVAEVAAVNESRADLPDLVVEEALIRSYYGDDPRYFAFPSPEQMADFDLAVAEEVYMERFGNAGDFAFAFVGDFDVDEMTDMASRYIGSLPGSGEREEFIDTQPLPSRQVQVEVVESGADPQGSLSMFFTNPHDPGEEDYVTARLMSLIVNARLRDKIREEMSATYSVFGGIDLQRDPDPFAESFVTATGAPEDLERISDAVLEVLDDIRVAGPTGTEFATAVEQLRDELDLIDNPTLADALLNAYLYPDEPVTNLGDRAGLIDGIDPDDVRRLAAIAYDPNQRIEIRLIPRS